jgi:hypothetical protein
MASAAQVVLAVTAAVQLLADLLKKSQVAGRRILGESTKWGAICRFA